MKLTNISLTAFIKTAKAVELSATDLETCSDQLLTQAYNKRRAWQLFRHTNKAKITMELMNRGILKTYKSWHK
jgi:hypothetical protein